MAATLRNVTLRQMARITDRLRKRSRVNDIAAWQTVPRLFLHADAHPDDRCGVQAVRQSITSFAPIQWSVVRGNAAAPAVRIQTEVLLLATSQG
jgi:hypothetical protein